MELAVTMVLKEGKGEMAVSIARRDIVVLFTSEGSAESSESVGKDVAFAS